MICCLYRVNQICTQYLLCFKIIMYVDCIFLAIHDMAPYQTPCYLGTHVPLFLTLG